MSVTRLLCTLRVRRGRLDERRARARGRREVARVLSQPRLKLADPRFQPGDLRALHHNRRSRFLRPRLRRGGHNRHNASQVTHRQTSTRAPQSNTGPIQSPRVGRALSSTIRSRSRLRSSAHHRVRMDLSASGRQRSTVLGRFFQTSIDALLGRTSVRSRACACEQAGGGCPWHSESAHAPGRDVTGSPHRGRGGDCTNGSIARLWAGDRPASRVMPSWRPTPTHRSTAAVRARS